MDATTAGVIECGLVVGLLVVVINALVVLSVVKWCTQGKGLIERRPVEHIRATSPVVDVTTHYNRSV